jgi:hypothetical protein
MVERRSGAPLRRFDGASAKPTTTTQGESVNKLGLYLVLNKG